MQNSLKILLYFSAIFVGGCEKGVITSIRGDTSDEDCEEESCDPSVTTKSKVGGSEEQDSTEPQFLLTNKPLTNRTTADIDITCGTADQFAISEGGSAPSEDSSKWRDCLNGEFTASWTLSSGVNSPKLYFRDADRVVNETSGSFELFKADVIELSDPVIGASDFFGGKGPAEIYPQLFELGDGSYLVGNPDDETMGSNAGAFHVFSGPGLSDVTSFYGDAGNVFGHNWDLTDYQREPYYPVPGTSRFFACAMYDDDGATNNVGSVRLIDGKTGLQVGSTIKGDDANDNFCTHGAMLSTGNLVSMNPQDDHGGVTNAGSIYVISGKTGEVLATHYGAQDDDDLGWEIVELTNKRFLAVNHDYQNMGGDAVGSIMLFDSEDGSKIGSTYFFDDIDDLSLNEFFPLANGNFVVVAAGDDNGGDVNFGSVNLFSGSDGSLINRFYGTASSDFSSSEVNELPNGNFVLRTRYEDNGGDANAGAMRLIKGTDLSILKTAKGDDPSDSFGLSGKVLSNGNFLVWSNSETYGGVTNAGAIYLYDGETGDQLGTEFFGDRSWDLSSTLVVELDNDRYVVAASSFDVGANTDNGRIKLFNSETGAVLKQIDGSDESRLGYRMAKLATGDLAVYSFGDATYYGTISCYRASSLDKYGATTSGDDPNDSFGRNIEPLSNGNFFASTPSEIDAGKASVGSYALFDGETCAPINGIHRGVTASDRLSDYVHILDNDNIAVVSPYFDNGLTDTGNVRLIDGETGVTFFEMNGTLANDAIGETFGDGDNPLQNGHFGLWSPYEDKGGFANAGTIRIIVND